MKVPPQHLSGRGSFYVCVDYCSHLPLAAATLDSSSVRLVAWEHSCRAKWTSEASLLYGIIDCRCRKDQENKTNHFNCGFVEFIVVLFIFYSCML